MKTLDIKDIQMENVCKEGNDDTFKKKGEKFVSKQYDIEVVEFVKGKYEASRVYLAI